MSGLTGHALGHIVRRGVDAAQEHLSTVSSEHIQKLQQDAQLYEKAGAGSEIKPQEMLPILITGIIFVLLIASVSAS